MMINPMCALKLRHKAHKARNIINNVMILPEISLFKQSEDRVWYEKPEITVEKFEIIFDGFLLYQLKLSLENVKYKIALLHLYYRCDYVYFHWELSITC